ncbi:hypothetical protein AB0I84_34705 [Streptomyces spectabilis]|uniref:hypothetical protein n=1 Tax=Streptomyces spectabilis TaxID=68270 RepID=UPI003406D21E
MRRRSRRLTILGIVVLASSLAVGPTRAADDPALFTLSNGTVVDLRVLCNNLSTQVATLALSSVACTYVLGPNGVDLAMAVQNQAAIQSALEASLTVSGTLPDLGLGGLPVITPPIP